MCRKDREQRIPDFTELLAELDRLGVGEGTASPDIGYAASASEVAAADAPLPIDMDNLPANDPTLSFDTQDEEIRAFVDDLKRRKRKRGLLGILLGRKR